MAKKLRLLFFGSVIVGFAFFGYLNVWQFFISGSADSEAANFSASFMPVFISENDEAGNVENSHELIVKRMQKRTWDQIEAKLAAINSMTRYKHNSTRVSTAHSQLALSTSITSSWMTPPLTKLFTLRPTPQPSQRQHILPFLHSTDAVPRWNTNSSHRLTIADIPIINVTGADCTALFRGSRREVRKARNYQNLNKKEAVKPIEFIKQASNCTKFVSERRYAKYPVNSEEAEYPIAFSVLMFKEVEQFERLLRAIYRPQNFYCIHIDKKSHHDIRAAVIAIARCFKNVLVLKHSFNVMWGTYSVLEPELACMKRLLMFSKKWRYFINLTGQEFPLKTNWQIMRILKAFNGSNNMEGTILRRNEERFEGKPPPPYNISATKGSVHIVAVRDFVTYVIYNETAAKFLDWVKDTYIPDETFFSSLNHNPHLQVPGSYLGEPETDEKRYRFLTRFKNWGTGPFDWPCSGKRVSMVCIFAVGDLPLLASRPELFANKFYLDYEPLVFDCIEQLHYRRLYDEVHAGDAAEFDTSLYSSQNFVWNHV